MGSVDFQEVYWGQESAGVVFDRLRDQATYQYGADGYNGTISTTNLGRVDSTPVRLDAARRRANDQLEAMEKGVCRAVALLKVVPAVRELVRTETVTVTVKGALPEGDDLAALVRPLVKAGRGQLVEAEVVYPTAVEYAVKAAASKGATETRYFVLDGSGRMPAWERGWESQAAARAAVVEGRVFGQFVGECDVEVVAVTRRASGAALVTAERRVKSTTATVTVKVLRETAAEQVLPGSAGWLFYGSAPC